VIIVVLKNPDPVDLSRKDINLEVRMMIEGVTMDEADALGEAIKAFAQTMNRYHMLSAFQLNDELAASS
jgi:hypothetical protein